MNRPCRVAMVTPRYLPLMGGIETHVHEVGRRLGRSGVDLTILTTDVTRELDPVETVDSMLIRRFDAHPRSKDYYVSAELLRALATGSFDLVHVQGVHTALAPMALATAQRRAIPTVVTFHTGGSSSRIRARLRDLQWSAERPILRRAKARIAVCAFEVEWFSRRLRMAPSDFSMIRNGCEPLPTSDEPVGVTGAPLILSIGRLEEYKGHHRAILAMPDVLQRAPSARLAVVGRGPYESELRALSARLGLHDSVIFTSFAPTERQRLGNLVHRSNAVVLLSDYEANPVAIMEALGLGANVLVAMTSGLTELADAGLATGVELDAAPSDVGEALLRVSADTRWSRGPPDLPSWDQCAEQVAGVYEEAIASSSPAA
jgi:glycosyltransferase involved in cell wall biosynthesis